MALFNVGFVIFPDVTQLDFTGPLQLLSGLPQSGTHIVAKSMSPVVSDCRLGLVPTHTFGNCPPLDLICIPGGSDGVAGVLNDGETIEFVRQQAISAKYVTSVCTGAFVLGVAGLLKGRRATTHWAYADLLPLVGAKHEKARVVMDGNVITAGGVTSGIDFGLVPKLQVRARPDAFSSAWNTTRRHRSIPAILTERRPFGPSSCPPATTSSDRSTAHELNKRPCLQMAHSCDPGMSALAPLSRAKRTSTSL
jgi:cyclohexyl-isocyanide hydratase